MQRQDEINQHGWTSRILQQGTIELFACKCTFYPSRKRRNDAEDTEIIRASAVRTGARGTVVSSGWGRKPPTPLGALGVGLVWGPEVTLPPSGAGGQSTQTKRIILEPYNLIEFALLALGLAWDPPPLRYF